MPRWLRRALIVSLATTAVPALAQDALGDGRALDRNQRVGSGGYNTPGRDVRLQAKLQNAIVTNNAAGGVGFRGSLGYSAENDFRGELGSNDLFSFERDSFYSGLAARNVRSIDALRQQMQFATGLGPSAASARALSGPVVLDRAGTGATAGNIKPPSLELDKPIGIDPFSARPRSLRATSEFLTANTLEPVYFAGAQGQEGQQLLIGATPLRGIVTTEAPTFSEESDEDADLETAAPRARLDSNAAPSEVVSAEPASSRVTDRVEPARSTYDAVMQRMMDTYQGKSPDVVPVEEPAPVEPEPADGEEVEIDPADEFAQSRADFAARLERLRQSLLNEPVSSGDAAAVTQGERMSADEIRQETRELFGAERPLVNSLVNENAIEGAYNERMKDGQRLLALGFWFDAEERFVSALGVRPGDPFAAVGRMHAALGAGLFRSASSNLIALYQAHPELAGVRFDAALLPTEPRLGEVFAYLRDASSKRDDMFARDAGLLLAYLGYQAGSSTDVRAGFEAVDRIDAWLDAPSDPLVETLRTLWLDDAAAD